MKTLLVALVLLVANTTWACGCVDWSSDRRMTEADRVFLARAKKRDGSDDLQHFTVLLWLKGRVPGAEYAIKRATDDDCERTFTTGELALVFEAHGKMPVCNGNVDLDDVLPTLGDYLVEASTAMPALDSVTKALTGRFGRDKKVTLYCPQLSGSTLSAGGTQVTFTATHKDDLGTLTAVTRGDVTWVRLHRASGSSSTVLVGRERGKLVILASLERPNLR
ncbi:MAG: hypothetical protein ABI321_17515 [Polyangia bacterium]